jgi:hypothetical protein
MATEASSSKPAASPATEAGGATSRPRSGSKAKPQSMTDPILRNAVRYTISAREYETLHRYVLSRSRLLKRRVPSVNAMDKFMEGGSGRSTSAGERDPKAKGKGKEPAASSSGGDTYNARAIRHAIRVFITTGMGLKLYDSLMALRTKAG